MFDNVKYIKQVTREVAEEKALPLLLAGYLRRGSRRSARELALRDPTKVQRDLLHQGPPRILVL